MTVILAKMLEFTIEFDLLFFMLQFFIYGYVV